MIRVRYAEQGDYDTIARFLDEHWAKNHVYVRERGLFDWTFRRPLWDREGYSFALAEDGRDLVGIVGGIPFALNRFGERSLGIWPVNHQVLHDRVTGLTAIQLLNAFRREPFTTIIDYGHRDSLIPIYRPPRWQRLQEMPRHLAVLPGCGERMQRLLALAHPAWPAERAAALAGAFALDALPRAPAWRSELPDGWDAQWDAFARTSVGPARDLEYLTWRYAEHPLFRYRPIAVEGNDGTGLAVWRLEEIRHGATGEVVDRLGRLVEFLPASRRNAEALLAAFWSDLASADALGADYHGFHGGHGAWLRELGFRGLEAAPDGQEVPSRFQPLDGKNPGSRIQSAILLDGGLPPCAVGPENPWYWTKSDSDQDRPN